MNGVCDWLDPKVLDIWLVDAPMKNNAEDAMKERLFLLWSENHNITSTFKYHIVPFQIPIFFV
jgi:hypothetical protein